jgi:hypothetical protein
MGVNTKGLLIDLIYRKLMKISYRNKYNNIEVNDIIEIAKKNTLPFQNIGFAWIMTISSVINILMMTCFAFILFGYYFLVTALLFFLLQISTMCLANKQRHL